MKFFVLLGISVNIIPIFGRKLPDYITACKKSDPEINKCIQTRVEDLRPYLIQGMPELNVPSIEPMIIPELVATEGSGLKVTTKDLKVFGASNYTIIRLSVDLVKHTCSFQVSFSHLEIQGKYDVDGKIIMIPIKGNGDMNCDAYEILADIEMDGEMSTREGVEYLKFARMNMDVAIGKGRINLTNLFNGDKLIGEVINSAINLNFQYFIKELKPNIEKALSLFILDSANQIVSQVPYNEVFPE